VLRIALVALLPTGCGGKAGNPLVGAGTLYFSQEDNPFGLFEIDVTTGAMTQVGAGNTGAVAGDNGLTGGPGGLIGSTSADSARIATDGLSATVLPGSENAEGLAYHPSTGLLYASANSGMKSVNPVTGLLVSLLTGPGEDLEGLASDGVGTIYGVGESLSLHAYDVATDTWSIVGPTGLAFELNDAGLAYDPAQDVLYAIAGDANLYRLDPNTGTATLIGPTGLAAGIGGGLGFIPD
jgi:uncharacterized protein YjiK